MAGKNRAKNSVFIDKTGETLATTSAINAVNDALTSHLDESATTSQEGHVQLSSSTSSTSTSLAATASAVKTVNDALNAHKEELTSHIDDDDNPHEVKAEQIEYDNTESELATTTVQGAIDEVNADLASHKLENMPHRIKDITNNKTYRYGLQVKNGATQFIYEEVL